MWKQQNQPSFPRCTLNNSFYYKGINACKCIAEKKPKKEAVPPAKVNMKTVNDFLKIYIPFFPIGDFIFMVS